MGWHREEWGKYPRPENFTRVVRSSQRIILEWRTGILTGTPNITCWTARCRKDLQLLWTHIVSSKPRRCSVVWGLSRQLRQLKEFGEGAHRTKRMCTKATLSRLRIWCLKAVEIKEWLMLGLCRYFCKNFLGLNFVVLLFVLTCDDHGFLRYRVLISTFLNCFLFTKLLSFRFRGCVIPIFIVSLCLLGTSFLQSKSSLTCVRKWLWIPLHMSGQF